MAKAAGVYRVLNFSGLGGLILDDLASSIEGGLKAAPSRPVFDLPLEMGLSVNELSANSVNCEGCEVWVESRSFKR